MSDKVELVYFNVQGRGTIIRMLLRIWGGDWEDNTVSADKATWTEKKPEFEREALGALPLLKLNGQTFCQTDAITEWAADKAGVISDDPVQRLKEKMITETFKEVGEKAFMAGMFAAAKVLGKDIMGLPEEEREERNKVFVPTMVQTATAMLPRVEKVLKDLNLSGEGKYLFGDSISVADLQCLAYTIFFDDAEFNKYADMKKVIATSAPTVLKLATKAKQHPAIAEYMAADGAKPYTGLNILW